MVVGWPDDDVVVGIAVIGNQRAAVVIAGKLDFAGVDLIYGSNEGLTIGLKHDFVRVDSSGGQLRVNPRGYIGVSTNHVQRNAVGAELLGLGLIVEVMLWDVVRREAVVVAQLLLGAGEDSCARRNHLWREGELLAVEDEGTFFV